MDLKSIVNEIGKLEREKAQLELREQQLREKKATIDAELQKRGLTAKTLEARIEELKTSISQKLETLGINTDGLMSIDSKDPLDVLG